MGLIINYQLYAHWGPMSSLLDLPTGFLSKNDRPCQSTWRSMVTHALLFRCNRKILVQVKRFKVCRILTLLKVGRCRIFFQLLFFHYERTSRWTHLLFWRRGWFRWFFYTLRSMDFRYNPPDAPNYRIVLELEITVNQWISATLDDVPDSFLRYIHTFMRCLPLMSVFFHH